jgi:phage tail sheath protein FI
MSIAGGIFGSASAKKAERRARARRRMLEAKLNGLERNRQDIINPYEGVQDLSSMMSNPFASLGVATQAAEMQIEEADISLANTLDLMRTTGSSAGGATALAQAALRSKKGVAASIEQQEASNERARAQGEQSLQQQLKSEQQRLQQADVQGRQFMFQTREGREVAQMDRIASQISGSARAEAQAGADSTSAITGMFGSLANLAGSRIGA